MSYTDTTTGEPIDGKAYLLRSTDGEDVVDPRRLFADAPDLGDVVRRLEHIEQALGLAVPEDQEPVVEQEPGV